MGIAAHNDGRYYVAPTTFHTPRRSIMSSLDTRNTRRLADHADHFNANPDPIAEAMHWLSPETDLNALIALASGSTVEHFSATVDRTDACDKRRMLLYAPIYLSSYCQNGCLYCGFRGAQAIERKHLTKDEALRQADLLGERGFRHLLLVAGDAPGRTTPEYFAEIAEALVDRGFVLAVEIAPMSTEGYRRLTDAGIRAITLYQETYNQDLYAEYHPIGKKSDYDWRYGAMHRAAEAGMTRLGFGVLLGLADPVEDLNAMMRHASSLSQESPNRTLAFSLPRIRQAPPGFTPPFRIDDDLFIRMYCALRLAFPEAELVLSTREPTALREKLANICITQMSAGSSTSPGGYGDEGQPSGDSATNQQFPVTDDRSVEEVVKWLRNNDFHVTWSF